MNCSSKSVKPTEGVVGTSDLQSASQKYGYQLHLRLASEVKGRLRGTEPSLSLCGRGVSHRQPDCYEEKRMRSKAQGEDLGFHRSETVSSTVTQRKTVGMRTQRGWKIC